MSITVTCPDCFRPYDVPDKYEGKTIRCKSCGGSIRVTQDEGPILPPARPTVQRRAAKPADSWVGTSLFWAIMAAVGTLLLVLMVISLLPPAGLVIGFIFVLIGFPLLLSGWALALTKAFQEDVAQGLLSLFVPLYIFFYLATRWPKTRRPVFLYGAGVLFMVLFLSAGLAGAAAKQRQERAAAIASATPSGEAQNPLDGLRVTPPTRTEPPQPDFPPRVELPRAAPPQGGPPRFDSAIPNRQPPIAPGENAVSQAPPIQRATPDASGKVTIYLHGTNGFFKNRDPQVIAQKVDEELSRQHGYEPGSLSIDFEAGQMTFRSTAGPSAAAFASQALFRVGLMSGEEPSNSTWIDPTRPHVVTLEIEQTNNFYNARGDVTAAAEQLLVKEDGYVPGSLKVDLKQRKVAFESYPGSEVERKAYHDLFRVGLVTRAAL